MTDAPKQWPAWYRQAWDEIEPDLDGNRDREKVQDLATKYVRQDDAEAQRMAKARVEQLERELSRGVTQPVTAQLTLPGFSSTDWRPDEIYAASGKVVRAADAKPFMVARKAERSMADAEMKTAAARRLQVRANLYNQWFTEQVQEGRDVTTLSQQVWLDESGYLS